MKKITLLTLCLAVTSLSFGQASLSGFAENSSEVNAIADPCTQDFTGGPLQLANAASEADGYAVANDIVVAPGSTFELQSLNALLLPFAGSASDLEDALVTIYEDTGGFGPGAEIGSSLLFQSGETIDPETFAGYDMFHVEYEFNQPITLTNNDTTEARYWVGLTVTSASSQLVYFVGYVWDPESDSEYNYQSVDGGASYVPIESDDIPGEFFESYWTISGDCDVLSVNSNMLSQVSVYPNPTSGILNLQTPSNVDVSSVALFDILGKKVNADYNNSTINMSSLSQGIYILKVETSAGTLTQKIVKQ